MSIKIAIHGAAGRMGQRLVALGSQDPDLELQRALDSAQHPDMGRDAGTVAGIGEIGIPLSSELEGEVEAVIDFSVPAAAEAITDVCVQRKIPLVMATTGLSEAQRDKVNEATRVIPVVCAPNMSLAVNLTMKLSETAATVLKHVSGGVDVEIIERHHRFKEDAPSGTALKFGEILASAMELDRHVHGREGITGQRSRTEVGYHALRVGDNPGEHTIVFGMLGETIELRVGATNRDSYAVGALAAAKFVARQQPGMYSMYDVLGL